MSESGAGLLGGVVEQWQASAVGVLAKSARKDPSELPADAWKKLAVTTRDGITINPLYTRADEGDELPAPGQFPYVRGGLSADLPDTGWHVCAQLDTADSDSNDTILQWLQCGVSALWLTTEDGPTLNAALAEVYLDLAPVTLDAGKHIGSVMKSLIAEIDRRSQAGDGVTDRASIVVDAGIAPLTAELGGASTISLADAVALATMLSKRAETLRTFIADGTAFHNLGASDSQELGYATAAAIAYVRALVADGMDPRLALQQVSFRFSATDDQFQTIAKFRAGRQLWSRVAQVLGAPDCGAAPQHAVSSLPMMTQRDPWVNMLRSTLAAFGAGIGGAHSVTVETFDTSVAGGLDGTSRAFAERIARNTQLLLKEESHLGYVVDPAGGSWFVENLTADLAEQAWTIVQEVERQGGLESALSSGSVTEAIDLVRNSRDTDIAHRAMSVTGVNEFPNLDENPLDSDRRDDNHYRYGLGFELLRNRSDAHLEVQGSRPSALLIPLGSVAEHNVRTTFASNLLASGGVCAINPGPVEVSAIGELVEQHRSAGTDPVVVVCGTDKRYTVDGQSAVSALRSAGVQRIYLAGPSTTFAEATNIPDEYLTMRIDAVSTLSTLLDTLGVK